jgi:acyl carrier protein
MEDFTMDAVKEDIKAFLSRALRNRAVADEQDIFAAGFVNSLFAMQLVMFVEKKFGVAVGDEDLDIENFKSVNAMAAFVAHKRGSGVRDIACEVAG